VWGAITLFTHVPLPPKITKRKPIPCVMRVVRVSGTIKKSEEEAIRRARADILKAKRIQRESGVSIVSTALDAIFGTSGNSQSVDQEGGIIDEEDEDESQTEMID
jgi:ribonuclease P/MRP protein subunit POP5